VSGLEELETMSGAKVIIKIPAILLGALIWTAAITGFSGVGHAFEVDSRILATLEYPVPDTAEARTYLGLSGAGTFRLSQLKADLLIIEVFSMYCPYCQAEAPNVNGLYTLIEGNPKLKERVRIVGIGIGNTPFEVNVFKKKFQVPFPLLPDDESTIAKSAPKRFKTPAFIVLKMDRSGVRVVKVHVGRIENIENFIQAVAGP